MQQNNAKINITKNVDNNWVKDWSQKVLAQKYREPQKDYFGKKGLASMLMSYIRKKMMYFRSRYILQFCEQNLYQTLAVTEHVANQTKKDYPNIKDGYMKYDNAMILVNHSVGKTNVIGSLHQPSISGKVI